MKKSECFKRNPASRERRDDVVREQGFEPQLTDPESVVLPLDDSRMNKLTIKQLTILKFIIVNYLVPP